MRSLIFLSLSFLSGITWACTDEYAPVCGYWMHTPRTQTYPNRCKMMAAGAKLRHEGSCHDQPAKNPQAAGAKPNK